MPEVGFRYISYNEGMPEETAHDHEEERRRSATEAPREVAKQGHSREAEEKQADDKNPSETQSKPSREEIVISFKNAQKAAEVLTQIRNEEKVVVSPKDFDEIKQILVEAGYDLKRVGSMSRAQIVVAAQGVLRDENVVVSEPIEDDWLNEANTPLRQVEELEARQLIEIARSIEEETLDAEKVEKYLEVSTKKLDKETRKSVRRAVEDPGTKALKIKGTFIVVTSTPLFYLKHSGVAEVFATQGVDVGLPPEKRWNGASVFARKNWLENHNILNTTELPRIEGDALVYEDRKNGLQLYVNVDGSKSFVTRGEVNFEALGKLLEKARVGLEVESPDGWDGMTLDKRKKWFKERGIHMMPSGEGGGTRYHDTQNLGADLATGEVNHVEAIGLLRNRFNELYDLELTMGATFDGQIDKQEVYERLRDVSRQYQRNILRGAYGRVPHEDYKREVIDSSLEQLKFLGAIERDTGTAGFRGYNPDRLSIYEEIADLGSANEIIQRLINLRIDPAWPALSVENRDEYAALTAALNYQRRRVGTLAANQREGFRFVNNWARTIEDVEILVEKDPARRAALNDIIAEPARIRVKNLAKQMDQHFNDLVKGMGSDAKARLFAELEGKNKGLKGSYSVGSITQEDLDWELYQFAKSRRVLRGNEGLMEWRASVSFESFKRTIEQEVSLGVPDDWRDSERNANNNFRYVESSDLSAEEMGDALKRVGAISEALSHYRGPDKLDAQEMKDKIDQVKLAVEAKYLQRRGMWNSDSDPEKFIGVFSGDQWTDETRKVYQSRFDRDNEGDIYTEYEINPAGVREILYKYQKDAAGHYILDAAGDRIPILDTQGDKIPVTFNMLDLGESTYGKQLLKDKDDFNLIEGLTAMEIGGPIAAGDPRIAQVEGMLRRRLLREEITRLEELRGIFFTLVRGKKFGTAPFPLKAEQFKEIEDDWARPAYAKDIIYDWFRENTLAGAHGEDPTTTKQQLDLWKTRLRDNLKDKLLDDLHVPAGTVEDYEAAGLLDQAINVAYWEKYMDCAFMEYGVIRVFDRNKVFYEEKNAKILKLVGEGNAPDYEEMDVKQFIPSKSVYGYLSNLYHQRLIDFGPEWLVDELRGRTGSNVNRELDTDFILWRHMLGKRRGMLDNNRMTVKYISDNLGIDESPFKDDLLTDKAKRSYGFTSFKLLLDETKRNMDNIGKLDIDKDVFDDRWANGAAIAELAEDGFISFENIKWSEVYRNDRTNVTKYNMGDWNSDRKATKDFFGVKGIQRYLKTPNTKVFFEVMSEEFFYSKRENRLKPWYKLVMPAHFEMGDHWKEWWGTEYNMANSEKEEVINQAGILNRLEKEAKESVKEEQLKWGPLPGIVPVRWTHQWVEAFVAIGKETATKRSIPIFWAFLMTFLKGIFTQSQAQLEGK